MCLERRGTSVAGQARSSIPHRQVTIVWAERSAGPETIALFCGLGRRVAFRACRAEAACRAAAFDTSDRAAGGRTGISAVPQDKQDRSTDDGGCEISAVRACHRGRLRTGRGLREEARAGHCRIGDDWIFRFRLAGRRIRPRTQIGSVTVPRYRMVTGGDAVGHPERKCSGRGRTFCHRHALDMREGLIFRRSRTVNGTVRY